MEEDRHSPRSRAQMAQPPLELDKEGMAEWSDLVYPRPDRCDTFCRTAAHPVLNLARKKTSQNTIISFRNQQVDYHEPIRGFCHDTFSEHIWIGPMIKQCLLLVAKFNKSMIVGSADMPRAPIHMPSAQLF